MATKLPKKKMGELPAVLTLVAIVVPIITGLSWFFITIADIQKNQAVIDERLIPYINVPSDVAEHGVEIKNIKNSIIEVKVILERIENIVRKYKPNDRTGPIIEDPRRIVRVPTNSDSEGTN